MLLRHGLLLRFLLLSDSGLLLRRRLPGRSLRLRGGLLLLGNGLLRHGLLLSGLLLLLLLLLLLEPCLLPLGFSLLASSGSLSQHPARACARTGTTGAADQRTGRSA